MATDVLATPPRTIMEVFKMLPEGTLAELVNGVLYMSPAPNVNHQRAIGKLFNQIQSLLDQTKSGEAFIAPLDVYFDEESNAVQPDVVFVSKKKASTVHEDGIHGTPDFIIEILSPGNTRHDLIVKKELYEKFGVSEYWIVDPDNKTTIGYTYQNKKFTELPSKNGRISSKYFDRDFEF